jgi:hypothetical protein
MDDAGAPSPRYAAARVRNLEGVVLCGVAATEGPETAWTHSHSAGP